MELEKSSSQTSDYTTKQHWLNSMAMEQKQTYRSIEHDRKAKNKPWRLWSINLWQRMYSGDRNIQWSKNSLFNKWCSENWRATFKRIKLEYSLISYTHTQTHIYTYAKCKVGYYKTPRGKHRQNTLWHKLQHYFSGPVP